MSSNSNKMGDLDQVVEALKDLVNDGSDSDESNSSNSGDDTKSFFCVEDSLLTKNVKVSVNEVGLLNYPIKNDVIEKLIGISEKAKFGKGTKTVLDTSYRDTQMIPADKLKVDIDEQVLNNLLQNLRQALNIEDHSNLEIHLYNMLIYGPGQFFKRHRDTEKVPNMIATLVMVLPSLHKGGDLIIQHHSLKHRFFGSLDHEIIKCIAFYSDCFHEVKEVDEGYRVALTYNVEIKSGPIPNLMNVNENLKDAVNNYFEESKSDMLVYFLDHQYTEHSLRWYMLKGADRICGKALLAVGKLEGYPACLALADYHESWPEDCEDDPSMLEKETELYFWIDENNIAFDSEKISVSEDKICFMKDTKEEFDPYKREEEGNMGNYAGNIDEWYHRSAVVLWRDTWAFLNGYKKEVHALHLLTAQPGMQTALLKKIKENSKRFFSSPFWDDESVRKMALEIMMYLNNKDVTLKILVKYKPSEVLDLTKNEIASWIATNCDLETWKIVIKAWESTHKSEALLKSLLPFLLNYMTKEDKDLGVAGYLLDESAKFFMNPKRENEYSYSYIYGSHKEDSKDKDKQLCLLLQIAFQLGKLDLEKQLMKSTDSKSSVAHFKMFEETLQPEQFARISSDLLSNMTNAALGKIKKEDYIYAKPNQAYIQDICALLQTCRKIGNKDIEQKIIHHIISNPTFTASFLADLIFKMKLEDFVSNYEDLKNHALKVIQAELQKLKNPNDASLSIRHPCNCQYCRQVQRFFASAKEMQVIIPAAKNNRAHIYSYLNPLATYLPIKLETIRTGSPYKLTVTKLPKLLQDRKNLIERLTQARKLIAQVITVEPEDIIEIEDDAPAAKKSKIQ